MQQEERVFHFSELKGTWNIQIQTIESLDIVKHVSLVEMVSLIADDRHRDGWHQKLCLYCLSLSD
jgi:hypothetical protein